MMEWLLSLAHQSDSPLMLALILGLVFALDPCPMLTNIAAIGYISTALTNKYRVLGNGLMYALGRTLAYGLLAYGLRFLVPCGGCVLGVAYFVVGYGQNLLGYNSFRWDRRIEPRNFEKVKKQFVYDMEAVSEAAVTYFFVLAMAQADYDLAVENQASSDTLYAVGLQRHKIAAISQADLLTLELDKVNARNTLENATIALKRAMFSLACFLNLDKNTSIDAILPDRPLSLDISVDQALTKAKENNPEFLTQRQYILEAEQHVDKTKKESRFNASVNASVGFNQVANNLGEVYNNLLQQDLVSVSVSIPLVDWGVRKGKYNMAKNNLNVVKIAARQEEVSVEEEVIMTVNDFTIQQRLISSAEEALELAVLAYEQTRRRFIIGKADINSLTLSLNRRQEARKNYVSSLYNYWLSFYKIRKLTLHDFETDSPLTERFDFTTGLYQ